MGVSPVCDGLVTTDMNRRHVPSRRGLACVATALSCSLLAACGGGSGSPAAPTTTAAGQVQVAESAHAILYFDGSGADAARPALDAIDAAYDRVVADLRPAAMPRVRVYIWSNADGGFRDEMIQHAGTYYAGVSGFVGGADEIHVRLGSSFATSASHEFVHCVTLAVNPRFANNPRWLWESVALFENRQFVDPATLDYMKAGSFPTLAELSLTIDVSNKVYQVGYVLGEFIVERWGLEALRSLVRTNGSLEAVLGVDAGGFEAAWRQWVTARYLGLR
jgi:hypothetical protein